MIDNVSAATAAPAASSTQSSPARTTYHTPFGDVIVEEINGTLVSVPPDQAAAGTAPVAHAAAQPAAQPAPAATTAVPTLQSEFGSQPFADNPTGSGPGGSYSFNPMFFATRATADKIAALLGGTVVEKNAMVSGVPFSQDQPNEMIQLANGREVNAGVVANFFNHGYSQSYIDTMIQKQIQGSDVI